MKTSADLLLCTENVFDVNTMFDGVPKDIFALSGKLWSTSVNFQFQWNSIRNGEHRLKIALHQALKFRSVGQKKNRMRKSETANSTELPHDHFYVIRNSLVDQVMMQKLTNNPALRETLYGIPVATAKIIKLKSDWPAAWMLAEILSRGFNDDGNHVSHNTNKDVIKKLGIVSGTTMLMEAKSIISLVNKRRAQLEPLTTFFNTYAAELVIKTRMIAD